MPTEIGSYEAKTHFPELLRRVRTGKSFTITHRGEAVAELVPIRKGSDVEIARAAQQLKTFMRSRRVRGVDIKALIEEGRR